MFVNENCQKFNRYIVLMLYISRQIFEINSKYKFVREYYTERLKKEFAKKCKLCFFKINITYMLSK